MSVDNLGMAAVQSKVSLILLIIDLLINWGLTLVSTTFQPYIGGKFAYSCVSWLSHTSTLQNSISKELISHIDC